MEGEAATGAVRHGRADPHRRRGPVLSDAPMWVVNVIYILGRGRGRLLPGAEGSHRPSESHAHHPPAHADRRGWSYGAWDVAGIGHPDLRLLAGRRARILRRRQGPGSATVAGRTRAQRSAGPPRRRRGDHVGRRHRRRRCCHRAAGRAHPHGREGGPGLFLRGPGGGYRRVHTRPQGSRGRGLRRHHEPERFAGDRGRPAGLGDHALEDHLLGGGSPGQEDLLPAVLRRLRQVLHPGHVRSRGAWWRSSRPFSSIRPGTPSCFGVWWCSWSPAPAASLCRCRSPS